MTTKRSGKTVGGDSPKRREKETRDKTRRRERETLFLSLKDSDELNPVRVP